MQGADRQLSTRKARVFNSDWGFFVMGRRHHARVAMIEVSPRDFWGPSAVNAPVRHRRPRKAPVALWLLPLVFSQHPGEFYSRRTHHPRIESRSRSPDLYSQRGFWDMSAEFGRRCRDITSLSRN